MEDVKSQLLDNEDNKNKLISKAWAVMGHNSDFLYQSISNDIISIMDGIRDSENGSTITDEEYEMIRSSVYPLLRALGPLVIDDSNYYAGIDYEHYYTYDAEDYNLSDEQMGEKHGKVNGFFNGYDDAVNSYAYDETPDEDESEYGPDYLKAYQESYVSAYKEGNVLGTEHRKDPVVKGKYDAGKYAYVSGYYAGNHHEEYSPDGDDYYQEDWMSDDYFEVYKQAYTDEYIRLYELGYENGKNDPEKEEMITPESLSMYHLATIIKNVTEIMKMHHPQYNLKLIQEMDSYYAPYGLIQGDDQLIDLDDDFKDGLTVKTGGPLEKLVKVQVDGQDLSSANYELRSGSTILTLKEAYLKTLDAGIHTLKLVYIDNVIQAQFVIRKTQKQTPSDNRRYSIPLTGVES